jgi:hypothetical protein
MQPRRSIAWILALAGVASACAGAGEVSPPPAAATAPAPTATPSAAPAAPAEPAPAKMVHAIFDAGSSGLRLQVFEVTRAADGTCEARGAPVVDVESPAEKNARGDGIGLADMTPGRDPGQDEKANTLRMEFPKAERTLADLWNRDEVRAWQGKITGVALLGTGGFRDVARIKKGARVLMRKLDREIEGWRKDLGKPPDEDWQAVTIEGEEEAVLAWLAARELGAKKHATIETGGKTCQYAWSDTEGWSSELGTNATKDFLKEPEFEGCTRAKADADKCIAAFGERFAASTIIEKGARMFPIPQDGALWVMGGGWKGTLDEMVTLGTKADRPHVGARFKIGDLYRFAKERACTNKEPRSGYEPETWCMRVSHAVAFAVSAYDPTLLKRHGAASAVAGAIKKVAGKELSLGRESFPRGAAVSGTLFSECHAAAAVATE